MHLCFWFHFYFNDFCVNKKILLFFLFRMSAQSDLDALAELEREFESLVLESFDHVTQPPLPTPQSENNFAVGVRLAFAPSWNCTNLLLLTMLVLFCSVHALPIQHLCPIFPITPLPLALVAAAPLAGTNAWHCWITKCSSFFWHNCFFFFFTTISFFLASASSGSWRDTDLTKDSASPSSSSTAASSGKPSNCWFFLFIWKKCLTMPRS